MATTPNLALTYLEASQAQKHVTINEDFILIDAIVQLSVLTLETLTAPPASPVDGDRHIIATAGATGAWMGQEGKLAYRIDGGWRFYTVRPGWFVLNQADNTLRYRKSDNTWSGFVLTSTGNAAPSFSALAINGGSIDANTKFSVKSTQATFSHDDVTPGSGDMRVAVNKSAFNKDAGFIFQNGWSTRALFGNLGNDDFMLKVSPNGGQFFDSMRARIGLHGRVDLRESHRRFRQAAVASGTTSPAYMTFEGTGIDNTAQSQSFGSISSASFHQQITRMVLTSTAAANSGAGSSLAPAVLWRGSSTDRGGFYVVLRGGIETAQTGMRFFMGVSATSVTGMASLGTNPSAWTNTVGVGCDAGQTNLRLIAGGTTADLGAGFPIASLTMYELILSCEPGASEIKYRIENLATGAAAEGTITSTLPAATQFLRPAIWCGTAAGTSAVTAAIVSLVQENNSLVGSRTYYTGLLPEETPPEPETINLEVHDGPTEDEPEPGWTQPEGVPVPL